MFPLIFKSNWHGQHVKAKVYPRPIKKKSNNRVGPQKKVKAKKLKKVGKREQFPFRSITHRGEPLRFTKPPEDTENAKKKENKQRAKWYIEKRPIVRFFSLLFAVLAACGCVKRKEVEKKGKKNGKSEIVLKFSLKTVLLAHLFD